MEEPPSPLRTLLMRHFEPAAQEDASRALKSTSDLFRILDEHAPGKFQAAELYDELVAIGFEEKLVGDGLKWQVKPKQSVRN